MSSCACWVCLFLVYKRFGLSKKISSVRYWKNVVRQKTIADKMVSYQSATYSIQTFIAPFVYNLIKYEYFLYQTTKNHKIRI